MYEYNFSIITPVIISGADKDQVELRTQSVKGILRWWFRFYKSSFLNVNDLRNFENEVFGSTENSASFYMRVINEPQRKEDAYLCMNDRRKKGENSATKNYFAIKRRSFSASQEFQLIFKFLPHFQYQKELENSIMLLSLFGGIGARWRRGFGSVQATKFELKSDELENLSKEINEKIKNLKGNNNKPDDFMSISNTKIYLIKPKNKFWNSWSDAMDNLRDNFYRELKKYIGKEEKITYKPSLGEREVSPLIIQIKKVGDNYFGVVLVWEKWDGFEKFSSFLEKLNKYEIKIIEIGKEG